MPDGTPPSVWRCGRVSAGRRATVFVGASNFRSSTLASLRMGSSDGGGDRTESGGGNESAANGLDLRRNDKQIVQKRLTGFHKFWQMPPLLVQDLVDDKLYLVGKLCLFVN